MQFCDCWIELQSFPNWNTPWISNFIPIIFIINDHKSIISSWNSQSYIINSSFAKPIFQVLNWPSILPQSHFLLNLQSYSHYKIINNHELIISSWNSQSYIINSSFPDAILWVLNWPSILSQLKYTLNFLSYSHYTHHK